MSKLSVLASSLALAGCSVLAQAGATAAAVAAPKPLQIKIIGLNDFHGNLESPGTFRADPLSAAVAAGGADYAAGYIAAARAANPKTIVVSAGDLIGASPMVSALFHDEPTIEVMNRVGLNFNAVGNHEFDDGKSELVRMQKGGCHPTDLANSCRGAEVGTPVPFEGAKFKFLAANVKKKDGNKSNLFPAYGVKQFLLNGQYVNVAFIGLTLKETPQIVTPTGVKGLIFEDEVSTINALVPELKAKGIESIVVLIHQGGSQTGPTPLDINACVGNLDGSPIKTIVSQLDDAIDLVVSGHTHGAYNCQLPLASGRLIPVTSANAQGRVLTDIDVTIDTTTRNVTAISARNKVVDRTNAAITPNAEVASIVAAYKTLVSPIANAVIGRIARDVVSSKDAACNVPAGDLIADSQLQATAAPEFGGAQLALMNPGGVRGPFTYAGSVVGEGDGNVTYGEAFTVQPFGNSLVTMTLNSQQIRDTLEQQYANCFGQTSFGRILLPSNGLRYEWDNTQACGAKVRNATLTVGGVTTTLVQNGAVLDGTRSWRVTVNNFLADGGDGFTVLKQGTARVGGAQDVDALSAYMASTQAPAPAYDPLAANLGKPRIVRLDGGTVCP
ncbi:MAG: bifunctional metallophosphatase/5'-nucleotidase [Ferribacterium limneticum]